MISVFARTAMVFCVLSAKASVTFAPLIDTIVPLTGVGDAAWAKPSVTATPRRKAATNKGAARPCQGFLTMRVLLSAFLWAAQPHAYDTAGNLERQTYQRR